MFTTGIIVLIASLLILFYMQKKFISFNTRVFVALILGLLAGILLQIIAPIEEIRKILNIYNIFSVSYIRLLQMIVYPLILVATLKAMTKVGENQSVVKSFGLIILILLATNAVAGFIAILFSLYFNINFDSLLGISLDINFLDNISKRPNPMDLPIYRFITDFIPTNPFADLTGSRPNSLSAIIVFSVLLGIAYLGIKKKEQNIAEKFDVALEVMYKIVMRLVTIILRLSPYGLFALIANIAATSKLKEILELLNFISVTYISIFVMFLVHSLMLIFFKFNIITYYKKVFTLLAFAFFSRSSAASIPLNINTQKNTFGVSEALASGSSSFGAILGQNGCAGIYPAILAVAMAPVVGIDPTSISFILSLVAIITISSFGIAGVGGGAVFAAIAVLSAFDMPLTIVALLIGIEPILDMARTALNVNGAVVSSLITAKINNGIDMNVYNNKTLTTENISDL
jgi:L-cystine uptake protein TcyP (sodium:dicarboxylate symporter family)